MLKKASRIVILFGLIMSMSWVVSSSKIFASPQNTSLYQEEELQIQAVSREVTVSKIGSLNENFDNYYNYSDSYGYSGLIPLAYVIRDEPKNRSTAVYIGTVYYEGVCQAGAGHKDTK